MVETDRLGADSFLTVNPVNNAAISLYTSWEFEVTPSLLKRDSMKRRKRETVLLIVRKQGGKAKAKL